MTLRDLNHWDFFKLILIVEYAAFLIFAPIILLLVFVFGDGVNFISSASPDANSIVNGAQNFKNDLIITIPSFFFFSIIFMMIKAAFLSFLCQVTRLGNIQIGNMKPRKNRAF